MSYRYYTGYRPHRSYTVPFAELVAPMNYVGEGIYTTVDAAAGFVVRALRAIRVKARENSAINILSGLDDRTLRDIGVPRSEIRSIAREMAENPGMDYRVLRRQ